MPRKSDSAIDMPEAPSMDALTLRQKVTEAFGLIPQELRRDGLAPLFFKGRKLAEITSYTPGTTLWYEICVYATADRFISAVKVFKKSQMEKDIYLADSFASLPELMTYLEAYDPTHDVTILDDLTDKRLSTAEAMIRAAALRQRMAEARNEYRAAAGELLTDLSRLSA
jgi:hypothetical protein